MSSGRCKLKLNILKIESQNMKHCQQQIWQGFGAVGTLICWMEWKAVQPLWKRVWHFFQNLP